MKNIHLIPTDKPSRLYYNNNDLELQFCELCKEITSLKENRNIYITSAEEITDGDWVLSKLNEVILFGINYNKNLYKKIILTTDGDLIKDSVQAIDDEFLEWFVKNPNCEEVEVIKTFEDYTIVGGKSDEIYYKIIIPKEEPKNICFQTGLPCGMQCFSEEACNTIRLKHTSKFIVFTLQDSEDWVQYSIALDSFEKADNFCQQFRDKKMSYLICQTLKQGYNGK